MKNLLEWLTTGDVSVQYQVHRDLLGSDARTTSRFKKRFNARAGAFASAASKKSNGHWGISFYQPKFPCCWRYDLLRCLN